MDSTLGLISTFSVFVYCFHFKYATMRRLTKRMGVSKTIDYLFLVPIGVLVLAVGALLRSYINHTSIGAVVFGVFSGLGLAIVAYAAGHLSSSRYGYRKLDKEIDQNHND